MKLRLAFRTGAHRGHVLEFEATRTLVLGRSSQADIQIYDERISRRHCALRVEPQGARVKDMGSGNGTFVNGVEIRETTVADGDVLAIGHTEIELRLVPDNAPAAPHSTWNPQQQPGPILTQQAAPPAFGAPAAPAFGAGSRAPQPAPAPQSPPGFPALDAPLPAGQLPGTMVPTYARGAANTPGPSASQQQQNPWAATEAHGPPPAVPPAGPPKTCALCQEQIPAAQLHLVTEHRGRVLCGRCAPRIEVPGYDIQRTLGEGAMGVVYYAHDKKRGIPVALKVLKARGEMTDESRARFIREASTAAQLEHKNIVRVLDLGEAPPFLYFVMEYVPGKSLKSWIEKHGALPLPSVVKIAAQVALALEHARERHIVHRDLKPENILVQDDGVAKLADFGLAKNVLTSGASGLTRPGDGLGTLPYMPPEQIENALYADHRSDVYSFGATIYHMLCGRPPFVGRTTLEYFNRIRQEAPPPISSFRQDVPRVLEILVEKALQKRPEERFQTVGDMLRILQQFTRTEFDTRQTAS